MTTTTPLAVIGMGAMGSRIAARLLAAAHPVTVYNRIAAKAEPLQERGARIARTPAQAARGARVVFTCLRGSDAELAAVTGPEGVLAGIEPGAVHVSLSTLPPSSAQQLAQAHTARGTRYLVAQLQGRPQAAEAGQLTVWASGPRADIDAAATALSAFAARTCYLGERIDLACAAKLAVNMLLFANIELFAEAASYLERSGVAAASVFNVLGETVFQGPLFKGIMAGLHGSHASDGTSVSSSLLDLDLLLTHAQAIGARLPATVAVAGQYRDAVTRGHGECAQTAVILGLAD